ncbi:MAG: sensor histidine kinase [Patescibacteria group bacterium]
MRVRSDMQRWSFIIQFGYGVWLVLVGFILVRYALGYRSPELLIGTLLAGVVITGLVWLVQYWIDRHLRLVVSQESYAVETAFQSLFERSPVAYLIISSQGIIRESNPAALKLLGDEHHRLEGENIYTQFLSDEDTDASVLTAKIERGLLINDAAVRLTAFTGEERWVMLSVYTANDPAERLLSLVDITEQKRVDVAKSEFVALATHQLRTPITAVRWNMELLTRKLSDEVRSAQEKYLTKIDRNVERMLALINDFLSVSKLEMGTFATAPEPINLSDFFDTILEEYEGPRAEKALELVREDQPPQLTVALDPRLMHIMVSNLVSNAVKYSRSQGTLTLRYQHAGDTLTITVGDDGIGVPAAEVDQLFSKFFRASNARAARTEGTGLGLYVIKQAAEQLGGSVAVQSAEGEGTTFTITLPATPVTDPPD